MCKLDCIFDCRATAKPNKIKVHKEKKNVDFTVFGQTV